MPFDNPIVGGTTLVRQSIHSPNYVAGISGWTVNDDGSAEFNNIVIRGSVVIGNNVIILDNNRNAIFIYNINTGHLVESASPAAGIDSFGNAYKAGWCSYFDGNLNQCSQLNSGLIRLFNGNAANNGTSFQGVQGVGPASNQPAGKFQSGTNNADEAVLILAGQDAAGTATPYLQTYRSNSSNPIVFAHSGTIEYSDPGTLVQEIWHNVAYQANWSNAGAPYDNVQYKRNVLGQVVFKGVAKFTGTDTAPSFLFVLPVGYRPSVDRRITSTNQPSADATGALAYNIYVTASSGLVTVTNFSGTINPGPVSLDNISFYL